MKLIVGLGNPGTQYSRTRHNAGFMVIDRLAEKHASGSAVKGRFHGAAVDATIGGEKCLLLKPLTFMNRSGLAVSEAAGFFKVTPEELLIVVDDLYLPVGAIRLRPGGGAGGHNGLTDIQRALGGDNYARLRVGVGLRPSGGKPPLMDQADFVLSKFQDDEEEDLSRALARAGEAAEVFAGRGLSAAMNAFNSPARGDKEKNEE
jgi:PTH1 family peptidyl-tRNA hydrolase